MSSSVSCRELAGICAWLQPAASSSLPDFLNDGGGTVRHQSLYSPKASTRMFSPTAHASVAQLRCPADSSDPRLPGNSVRGHRTRQTDFLGHPGPRMTARYAHVVDMAEKDPARAKRQLC